MKPPSKDRIASSGAIRNTQSLLNFPLSPIILLSVRMSWKVNQLDKRAWIKKSTENIIPVLIWFGLIVISFPHQTQNQCKSSALHQTHMKAEKVGTKIKLEDTNKDYPQPYQCKYLAQLSKLSKNMQATLNWWFKEHQHQFDECYSLSFSGGNKQLHTPIKSHKWSLERVMCKIKRLFLMDTRLEKTYGSMK